MDLQSKKRRLSYASTKGRVLHDTITLESSSNDTDLIDDSIEVIKTTFNWIRTPRSAIRKTNDSVRETEISVEEISSGFDLAKSPRTPLNVANVAELNNEKPQEIKPRRISLSFQGPAPGSLSKSKKRNVEQWLAVNAAELEAIPGVTPSPPKPIADDSGDLDPVIKDVLMAVYGKQWKEKHVQKCQTDIKRKENIEIPARKTDIKPRKLNLELPMSQKKDVLLQRLVSEKPLSKKSPVVVKTDLDNNRIVRTARRKIFPTAGPSTPKSHASSSGPLTPLSCLTPLPPSTSKKRTRKKSESSDEGLYENVVTPRRMSPRSAGKETPRRTFLSSLSVSSPTSYCNPEAQFYKLNFAKKKEELVMKLYKLYNSEIFDNQLPADMKITWNPNMRASAGFCYNRKITRRSEVTRSARIELSTRVVDRADRLRDTLVHELCHAAGWIIDGLPDGHGPIWTKWAKLARDRFPELPPISRKHNYDIAGKFTYRCTSCGYSINRQTKSIDIVKKRCGFCLGTFELLINKKKRGNAEVPEFNTTRTVRQANGFAIFVKENYKKLKETEVGKKHGELMKILGQQYAIYKSVVTPGKK